MFKQIKEAYDDLISIPVSTFNAIHKRHKFSDFLAYSIYDEQDKIYINNDNSYGAIIQCATRIKASSESSKCIETIINKLPDNVYLQISILGLRNITKLVEYWKNTHYTRLDRETDPKIKKIIKDTVDSMGNFYYEKTQEAISDSMTTTIKKYVLLFSIKGNIKSDIQKYRQDLFNILKSNNFFPENIAPNLLKEYIYELINTRHDLKNIPEYSNNQYINRQLVSPSTTIKIHDDYIKLDGNYMVSLAPINYPQEAHLYDFGEKLGNTLGYAINENQFKDNFIITSTITKLPTALAQRSAKSHSLILNQKWPENLFRKFSEVKKDSVDILDRVDVKKETLYAFDLNICVYGRDLEKTKENSEVVKKFWATGDSKINLDYLNGIHQLTFLASLPMNINDEYMFKSVAKYHTFFPNQISQFIPLEGDWGGNNPNLMMLSRRGNLAGLDLFVSDNNFNGYIVAASGAGKSVFLNMLVASSYARGDRVFILDYDNSFTKTVEVLGGQYVNLDLSAPISFNPFTLIDSEEKLFDDLSYISDFIYMLGSSKSEDKSEEEEKLLKSIIQEAIKTSYQEQGSDIDVTYIKDKLNVLNTDEDIRISDFTKSIEIFCIGGLYEKFFAGKCEFNIQKELISIEFRGIEEHIILRDPLIMLLTYHINQMMYRNTNRDNRIQIIFDEAHRFLGKNPRMDDFIEQAYRRARKYGGSIILATQGFGDIYSAGDGGLSKAGKVIVNNSSWKIFMQQNESSISMLLQSKLFNFTEIEEAILRSIKTDKGNYSEMLFITPKELKVALRLVMNKFFYYLTTTDADDKKKIENIQQNEGLNLTDAIIKLIELEKQAS